MSNKKPTKQEQDVNKAFYDGWMAAIEFIKGNKNEFQLQGIKEDDVDEICDALNEETTYWVEG